MSSAVLIAVLSLLLITDTYARRRGDGGGDGSTSYVVTSPVNTRSRGLLHTPISRPGPVAPSTIYTREYGPPPRPSWQRDEEDEDHEDYIRGPLHTRDTPISRPVAPSTIYTREYRPIRRPSLQRDEEDEDHEDYKRGPLHKPNSRRVAPSTIYTREYGPIRRPSWQRDEKDEDHEDHDDIRSASVRTQDVMTRLRSYEMSALNEMASALTLTGLADSLRDDEEYTIFAVNDSVLNSYALYQDCSNRRTYTDCLHRYNVRIKTFVTSKTLPEPSLEDCRSDGNRRRQLVDQLRSVMAGHVIQGRVLSDAMTDNTLLYSAMPSYNRHAVRINVFYRGGHSLPPLRTANCVPFERDNLASNGVIHMVHRVLPTVNMSISQLIATHPRLTIFSNLLTAMSLNPAGGPYTLYAPYDEAFSQNLTDQLERSTTTERIDLVRQHITRRVFCSSGLETKALSFQRQNRNVINMGGRRMTVTASEEGITVDGAEMIETDLMATDGVVHIIDRVLFRQIESDRCYPMSNPRVLNDTRGTFTSPNYPLEYGDNIDCNWLIVATSPDMVVSLQFGDFITEDLYYDYVRIFDGNSTSARLMATLTGHAYHPYRVFTSAQRYMFVSFTTDGSGVYRGFSATYQTTDASFGQDPCYPMSNPRLLNDTHGTFTSPNYPLEYGNNIDCNWLIVSTSPDMVVSVQFTDFATEGADYVNIYDGNISSARMIATLSGRRRTLPTAVFTSTQRYMFVAFTSDSSRVYRGFSAAYRTTNATSVITGQDLCYPMSNPRVLNDTHGTFTSPNYPSEYGDNFDCNWLIVSTSPDMVVSLQFTDFTTDGVFDYVLIYDGNNTSGRLVASLSGRRRPTAVYTSTQRYMFVTFTKESSVGLYRGFSAAYQSTNANPCYPMSNPRLLNDTHGTFTSPNYPLEYGNNIDCNWLIVSTSPDMVVSVQFTDFATEYVDYVRIYDGNNTSARLIAMLSGQTRPTAVYTSTQRYMFVRFTTDSSVVYSGFSATYRTTNASSVITGQGSARRAHGGA